MNNIREELNSIFFLLIVKALLPLIHIITKEIKKKIDLNI